MTTDEPIIGPCRDCGEEAALILCGDDIQRCESCAIWMGYCQDCGADGAIIDDSWDSGLCANCRQEAWIDERTERYASQLWDTGR